MAAIVKASSSIIKAKKFLPQKKSNTAAKVQSKSVSLIPKKDQSNNNPAGKLIKSPSEGLIKYNREEDATKIDPTPIRKKSDPILSLVQQIESKVIKVDKLLKTSLLSKKKLSETNRVTKEKAKFKKRESDLEKGQKSIPGIPKLGGGILGGFLEGVKRFFLFTLLGWVFFRILPLLPKLQSIAGFIGKAIDFGFTLFSGLVSGLTTFLAEGIKLTDKFTKGLGWISGARTEEDFNKFEKTFNRIVDLTILAAMLTADAGLDLFKGKGRGGSSSTPGGGASRARPGSGGRPKVTTSGGKGTGPLRNIREGLRNANPLNQKPSVTTSGGRTVGSGSRISEGIRNANPLKRGPRVTSSGGRAINPFSRLPKINAKSAVGGIKTLGIGLLLDYGVQVGTENVNKSIRNKNIEEFKKKSPEEQSKIIKRIQSRVDKEKEWQSGAGGVFDKIISLGGSTSSERISENLSQQLDAYKQIRGGSYYKGGIVGGYQTGGSVRPNTNKLINIELLTKKPEKIKSKKTIPGKDVGGENQIKKIFLDTSPEEISITKTISSVINPLASIFNFFGGGSGASQETLTRTKSKNVKGLPNPFQLLLKSSKIFKEDPKGQSSSLDFINKISASAIDTLLGNRPDKGIYRSIASSILFLANSIANKQIYGVKSSLSSILGFASGGNVPSASATNTKDIVQSQESSLRTLTDAIGFSMEQSSNKVLDSVRGEARKASASGRRASSGRRATGRQEMLEENLRRAGGGGGAGGAGGAGGGGGGGAEASSGSANERAILDMIAQAEGTTKSYGVISGGDVNKDLEKGKLTVKQVIELANSYGTPGSKHKWSGATGRYQFMPGTLQELVNKGVLKPNDKFTPEMQDKAALALARRRGVDPSKPLTKNDVYKLGGEWASLEGGPEMRAGGSYSYGGRSQVKYNANQALKIYSDKLKAAQQSTQSSGIEALSKGFRTGLKTGPSERIGGSSEYHIDARFVTGLALKDKIAMLDSMASAHASEGFTMEFSGSNVQGLRWNPNASKKEKEEFAKKVLVSHHSAREGYEPFDYYIVKSSAKDRFDKSAEGSNVMAPIIPGGTYQYQEGGGYGRFMILRDKNGNEIMRIGHGDQGLPSPKEIGKIFKMDELPDAAQKKPGSSKREYDVIIPLDHHIGTVPPKSLWPNASLGAAGRERSAQTPTAEIMKSLLEKKGLRVKIMRPEDYTTEDSYNKDLIRFSQTGSVVSSLHYDAPSNVKDGGIGFLARLGNSPDKNDRDYANKLAPILQSMANQAGGPGQGYGGIDTEGNITMRMAGPATAALIELGALVEQEKKYGKQFWKNPEFIKHLNDIADATASSVQKEQLGQIDPKRPLGQTATLNNKPVVWDGSKWIDSSTKQAKDIIRSEAAIKKKREESKKRDKVIAARPWYDKAGWFGGAAAEKKRKQEAEKLAKTRPTSTKSPTRSWWDPRGWIGKQEGGSIEASIGKKSPNIPIPNKFASYESPQGRSVIALQQIIVEKPSMDRSKRVTPSLSSSGSLNSSRMNRMQSTSRS